MHFPLGNNAFNWLVNILNRIFNRHNMLCPVHINLVNNRRQSRAFPMAGRAGHQD